MKNNTEKIKESFIQLLKTKKYHKISIQDITDMAKVSRRTFYQYYENKTQLYKEVIGDFIEWSLRPFEKETKDQSFSSKIEQFTLTMIDHLELVQTLFNQSCPDVLSDVIKQILISQIQEYDSGFFIGKLNNKFAQQYYVDTISQNCALSIRFILENKTVNKEELIDSLTNACDMISYFYNTKNLCDDI